VSKFANGHIANNSWGYYKANETAPIMCNTGFEPSTAFTRCTSSRLWNPEPTCIPITCNHPDAFINGQYNGSYATYNFGTVLVPTCGKGFFISNSIHERICERSNVWSGSDPLCEIIKCSRPTVLNGLFIPIQNFYNYNTQITIVCNTNLEIMNGPLIRICQEDGTWGSENLQCVKIMCNDTSAVKHESIDSYPRLAIGEIGSVFYNSTVLYLQNGSVDVYCSMERKMFWISIPDFGKLCNVLIDFVIT